MMRPHIKCPDDNPDFKALVNDVRNFLTEAKVGNIQINMFKGGISNWTINETKKPERKKPQDTLAKK